jgi:hypothetical protein
MNSGCSVGCWVGLGLVPRKHAMQKGHECRAHGVVVSHPLRMRKALGSIPSGSIFADTSTSGETLACGKVAVSCEAGSHCHTDPL